MEEETIKKRGRGRPRKEDSAVSVTKPRKKKKGSWGGKREGAGRKKGVSIGHIKEDPMTAHVSFRTHGNTLRRVQQLREITKNDDVPFNRMFEAWVEDIAKEYGIE